MNQWATSRPILIFCPVRRSFIQNILDVNNTSETNHDYPLTLEQIEALEKISDKLPNSAYKASIRQICLSSLFFVMGAATLACPALLPITGVGMALTFMAVGNLIMGLAGHFVIKRVSEQAYEERYDQAKWNVLKTIKKQEAKESTTLNQTIKAQTFCNITINFTTSEEQLNAISTIEELKNKGTITPSVATNALEIINSALTGNLQAIEACKELQKNSQPGIANQYLGTPISNFVSTLYNKYPKMTMVLGGLAACNAVYAAFNPSYVLTCLINFSMGLAGALAYESVVGAANRIAHPGEPTAEQNGESTDNVRQTM